MLFCEAESLTSTQFLQFKMAGFKMERDNVNVIIKESFLHLLGLKVTFCRTPSLAEAKCYRFFRSEAKARYERVNIAFQN